MLKRLSALLCLLLTLPSCGYVVSDTESLLRPPTLNKQQGEVYAALAMTLNPADITYKYPQRGERLSPFVFYDIDGNGMDEAIVFYSYNNDLYSTRAMVMMQDGGVWQTFHDFSMPFDQVDFIQFSYLLSTESACIVIGWQNTGVQSGRWADNALSIHSMSGGKITPEVAQRSYIDYIIDDFDSDGLHELVTVERDPGNRTLSVSLLRDVGRRIDVADTAALCPRVDAMLNMTHGRLEGGGNAVYIDETRVDSDVATEVVRVGVTGLTVLVGGNEESTQEAPVQAWDNYLNTLRSSAVLSRDYDGDGITEIPYPSELPGALYEGDDNPLMLTRMYHVTGSTLTVPFSAVINEAEGYMVYYPEKWEDRVSVRRDDASSIWQFYTVEPGSGDAQTELLRIQASDAQPDISVDANLIPLGSRGNKYFYGYIPLTTGNMPSITEAELMEMFKLFS